MHVCFHIAIRSIIFWRRFPMPKLTFNPLSRSTAAPASASASTVSFKTRQNREDAVKIAKTLEKGKSAQTLANLVGFAGQLASHLQEMRGAELSHDSTIVTDLCLLQEGLNKLRQEANTLSKEPSV